MSGAIARYLLTFLSALVPSVFALLAPATCLAQNAANYTIETVAGPGSGQQTSPGYFGDGGPATGARLNFPASVALDGAGNLYVCDGNATIRKVDARTGIISTVAGTGIAGDSGDGGPAFGAQLGGSGDLTLDRAGNILFADVYNHRIRRISAETGDITTIAGTGSVYETGDGGSAVEAGIGYANGIAVDQAENIYFTNGSDRVRKIDAATGIITTVAGGHGSRHAGDGGPALLAQLSQPSGLAFDARGNMYIAARGEHCIRKVNSFGIISTIAGVADGTDSGIMGIIVYQGGFSGDGGPATSARLNDPESIALDKAGNIYISDVMNYRVRRINALTGMISTIAGTGVSGFSGDGGFALRARISTPSGIAVNGDKWVYFGDQGNQRVRALIPQHGPEHLIPPAQTPRTVRKPAESGAQQRDGLSPQ